MRHSAAQAVALALLLMQAALGSLTPAGVICISQCPPDPVEGHIPAAPPCCAESCCASHGDARPERFSLTFTPPCENECPACVDVGLPDHEMLSGDRAGSDHELAVVFVSSTTFHDHPQTPPLRCRGPLATGPPSIAACPHAAILRSTRLLL